MKESPLKMTTIYLPQDIRRQLKILAAQEESSMTKLIVEGIEWVFRKRGIKVIKN